MMCFWPCGLLFLSTLSLRRATDTRRTVCNVISISIHALLAESDVNLRVLDGSKSYFYPRSPCGERRLTERRHWQVGQISIHALLAESDARRISLKESQLPFLSTLSLRRATKIIKSFPENLTIFLSTLSLRRATKKGSGKSTTLTHFYPRSPCGERQDKG